MNRECKPLFSCVIATYNKFEYLFEAIKSVLNQNYPKIELIVADDGSDNFPFEEVENYIANKMNSNIVRYKILHQNINVGTVKNINTALREIQGEYFLSMAGDDALYSSSTIGAIVEKFLLMDSNIISFSRQRCTESGMKPIRIMPTGQVYKFIYRLDSPEKQYHAFAQGMFFDAFSGSSISCKTSFMKKMGYYDERYRLVEDATFFMKVTRLGYKIDSAFDVIITKYREGGISNSKSDKYAKIRKIMVQDLIELYKTEILPNKKQFNLFERRYMKYVQSKRCLSILEDSQIIKKKQFILLFKYPDAIVRGCIYKIFRRKYNIRN